MEQQIFDVEAFNRFLVSLKLQANAHETKNEAARQAHNEAYFKSRTQLQRTGGPISTDEPLPIDIPDTALVSDPQKVGKSIVEFISTIPGVATENMVEVVSRPENIALSNRAVSALLRREKGAEVGMSLTFAFEGWPKHKLSFERIDPNNNRLEVSFQIGPDSLPIGGEINVGTIEDRQFVHNKHSIRFDGNGIVLKDSPEYGLYTGEKLGIVKMIEQVTTSANLGEQLNPNEMVEKAK